MFQLALGLLVVVLGIVLAGRQPATPRSAVRARLTRAKYVVAGTVVVGLGLVLLFLGLVDLRADR